MDELNLQQPIPSPIQPPMAGMPPEQAQQPIMPQTPPKEDEDEGFKDTSVIRVKLDEDEEKRFANLIESEMTKIAADYEEAGYFQNYEDAKRNYEGAKDEGVDFPVEGASNRNLLFIAMTADILAARGKRQTVGANPMCLMEKEEEIEKSKLRGRMDLLDDRLRKECGHEDSLPIFYKWGFLTGAIVKIPYCYECETYRFSATYKSTSEDIAKYGKKYSKQMAKASGKHYDNFIKLTDAAATGITDEEITVEEDREVVRKNNPAPYRVPNDKFFARLKIKDFAKHRVIAEELPPFTWEDIQQRVDNNFYDKKSVKRLTEYHKDYFKKQDFKILEAICRVNFDVEIDKNDDKKYPKGQARVFVVTYDTQSKIVLRCIHYPYEHMKPYYVVYGAIPRDDSWLPYSGYKRLEDVESIGRSFLNACMNEFTLAHSPIVLTDDPTFDGSRMQVDNLSVFKFTKGTNFTTMKLDAPPTDRIPFMQWVLNYGELLSGVSASLASGAETPTDKRAPAAKTAIKSQASNMRMEDAIIALQKADTELFEQVDRLYWQYIDKDKEDEKYFIGDKELSLDKDTFGKKVRYICHGSTLTFDNVTEQQMVMQFHDYLVARYPQVAGDPDVQYTLLDIFMNTARGTIEKNKDTFLKPLKMVIEQAKEIKAAIDKKQKGEQLSPQEEALVQEAMSRMAGNHQQQPPAPPQGGNRRPAGPRGAGSPRTPQMVR